MLTCKQCGTQVDPLAVFPGGICLTCHAAKVDKLPPEPPNFVAAIDWKAVDKVVDTIYDKIAARTATPRPNVDPETGVRYGVVCANHLDPDAVDDLVTSGQDLTLEEEGLTEDEIMNYEGPAEYFYEHDGYVLKLDESNDVWVLKSPYVALRGLCSPCAPNAGHLETEGGYPTYVLGRDWWPDGECPYTPKEAK